MLQVLESQTVEYVFKFSGYGFNKCNNDKTERLIDRLLNVL